MVAKKVMQVALGDKPEKRHPGAEPSWVPAPLADPFNPPADSRRSPKVESDPDVRAIAEARRKRVIGWIAAVLGLLAAPLGYIGKGIVDSWTESQRAEDAAAKAREQKIREIARKAGVDTKIEPSVEAILEALAERSAKCETAAASADAAKSDVKELQKNFLGYLVASGAVVRRAEGMPEPANVQITPAPRTRRPTALSPRPEVRFPPPGKP